MKKKKRKSVAEATARRRLAAKISPPATASKYLYSLKKYHAKHPRMRAVLYCRVSTYYQSTTGNLDTYEKILRRELDKRGIPIEGVYRVDCPGWMHRRRETLKDATKEALKHKDTVIITTSSDRFLRNKYYLTTKPYRLPTEAEFEQLIKLTRGVPLVTLLSPDMDPLKVRGRQTRWGKRIKGRAGGRPKKNRPGYKKARREENLPKVLYFHSLGFTLGDISGELEMSKSTVNYWVQKYADKTV